MSTAAIDEFADREFPMTDRDFKKIQDIAYRQTGIKLSDHKKNMIYGRLARRLRLLNFTRFAEYCDLIAQDNSPEKMEFINAITTNLTAFFREGHHFESLKSDIIPTLMSRNQSSKRIRIWSAGCSSGEEPYTIAMVLKGISALTTWDIKILATDLDTNVIRRAREGIYTLDRVDNVPQEYRRFLQYDKQNARVKLKDNVCEVITFKQLNLLEEWPMRRMFDVIFCRNVVIYFDLDTQKKLFARYANILSKDGYLIIGHSENLHNVTKQFKPLGKTIYQRAD